MSPQFVLGRENVACVAEVVNRSHKADCTDFTSCVNFYFGTLHTSKIGRNFGHSSSNNSLNTF